MWMISHVVMERTDPLTVQMLWHQVITHLRTITWKLHSTGSCGELGHSFCRALFFWFQLLCRVFSGDDGPIKELTRCLLQQVSALRGNHIGQLRCSTFSASPFPVSGSDAGEWFLPAAPIDWRSFSTDPVSCRGTRSVNTADNQGSNRIWI